MHFGELSFGSPASIWALRVEPFGAFLALGLVLGVLFARRMAVECALDLGVGIRALSAALVASLVTARLGYVLTSGEVTSWRAALAAGQGGLSAYGALFGAVAGVAIVLRRSLARATWFDVGALSALLVSAVASLGSFLAGSDFGRVLAHGAPRWLARIGTYPRPHGVEVSSLWFFQSERGLVNAGSLASVPVHPTPLYESLAQLTLLAVLLGLRRFQRRAGQTFVLATIGYALVRFGVEALRDEAVRARIGSLSFNRVAAFCSVLALALAWLWSKQRSDLASS
ncbi:MAG: prolipoprotein diacylglyceryl transferase family protein [Myxococcota bacterium]